MIFNKSDYNPFPAIKSSVESYKSVKGDKPYPRYFYDYIKKELFLGGVVPESQEEFETLLVQLKDMEII